VVNLQAKNYVLGRQMTILNPFSIFLYTNFRIRTFIEFPVRVNNVTYYLDMMFEFMDRIWVLEVDEHAHRSYDSDKDHRRTSALLALGKKVNLIRVNPDRYYEPSRNEIMPAICERQVILTRNHSTHTERKEIDLYVRESELERRLGVIFKVFNDAVANRGMLAGELILDGGVVIRKLFY
jgi:very-short-patch-repair endonuclease